MTSINLDFVNKDKSGFLNVKISNICWSLTHICVNLNKYMLSVRTWLNCFLPSLCLIFCCLSLFPWAFSMPFCYVPLLLHMLLSVFVLHMLSFIENMDKHLEKVISIGQEDIILIPNLVLVTRIY